MTHVHIMLLQKSVRLQEAEVIYMMVQCVLGVVVLIARRTIPS